MNHSQSLSHNEDLLSDEHSSNVIDIGDATNSRTADKFVVRFPDGMRSQIQVQAKDRNRSMNAEILCRLGASINYETEIERLKAIIDALLAVGKTPTLPCEEKV